MGKISTLPSDNSPSPDDYIVVNDSTSGQTKKVLLNDLASMVSQNISDNSISANHINFGGSGSGVWWEETARTTLTASADVITLDNIPQRKIHKIYLHGTATGGVLNTNITFQNDTSGAYYLSYTGNGATTAQTGVTAIPIELGNVADASPIIVEILLYDCSLSNGLYMGFLTAGAWIGGGSAPNEFTCTFEYYKTGASDFSRIDWTNAGAGSFDIGSEIIELGHD